MGKTRDFAYYVGKLDTRIPKPTTKNTGLLQPGQAALSMLGLMNGGTELGTYTNGNDVDGRAAVLTSAGGGANQAGYEAAAFVMSQSRWNPEVVGKFKLGQIVTQRLWIGLWSASPLGTDTPETGAIQGVGIRCSLSAANTNFVAYTSSGAVANLQDFATAVPVDNAIHTFSIEFGNAGAGVTITLDNQSLSFLTRLPTITQDLGLTFALEETAAAAKVIRIYYGYIEANR